MICYFKSECSSLFFFFDSSSIHFYQAFDAECLVEKEKLDAAGKARESMEKASNTENEVAALSVRWEAAKKVAEERVGKVREDKRKKEAVVASWNEIKGTK